MRRWLSLALLLVLVAPLAAQSVDGCKAFSVSRTFTADSFAVTVKGRCVRSFRVDSVALKAAQQALRDTTQVLVQVRSALKVATDSLAKWPAAPAPTPVPTPPPADTTPTPGGTLRPSGLAGTTTIDFSQTPPGQTKVDAPIPGAPGWAMIENSGWTNAGDGTWLVTFPAGTWGSPTAGWSRGSLFTSQTWRGSVVWLSTRFQQTGVQHPISNKFLEWSCSGALLLVQLKEGSQWLHAEQLVNGGNSFWINPDNTAGQVRNAAVTPGVWHTIEVLIDLSAKTWKVMLDGQLTTDARNLPFACSTLSGFATHAFRGGGGETLGTTSTWRFDTMTLGWK